MPELTPPLRFLAFRLPGAKMHLEVLASDRLVALFKAVVPYEAHLSIHHRQMLCGCGDPTYQPGPDEPGWVQPVPAFTGELLQGRAGVPGTKRLGEVWGLVQDEHGATRPEPVCKVCGARANELLALAASADEVLGGLELGEQAQDARLRDARGAGHGALEDAGGRIAGMAKRWRVGERYGVHVYECARDDGQPSAHDRPVATFFDPRDALAAVAEHNAALRRG